MYANIDCGQFSQLFQRFPLCSYAIRVLVELRVLMLLEHVIQRFEIGLERSVTDRTTKPNIFIIDRHRSPLGVLDTMYTPDSLGPHYRYQILGQNLASRIRHSCYT